MSESPCKVLRYLDGYERVMVPCWMILRGEHTFENDSTIAYDKLVSELPAVLSKYQCARLSLRNKETNPEYTEAYKPVRIQTVEWSDPVTPSTIESYKVPPMSEWSEGEPLIVVNVAQRGKDVQLTVKGSHTICDGRTIEGIYRIVASVIDSSIQAPSDAPFPSFGQRSLFTMTDEQANAIPPIWLEVPRNKPIYPSLPKDYEPVNLNTYLRYEWEPIRKYWKEHGVGTQSVLMAAACRANRKYNKFAADMPIYVLVPGDSRRSIVATADHAKREVFSGSSVVVVKDGGCEDVLNEIVECNTNMRETQKRMDIAQNVTFWGSVFDEKTGKPIRPVDAYPLGECPTVLVSNVGAYSHVKNPRLFCSNVCRGSSIAIYSYSSGPALELLAIYPKDLDKALIDATVAELDEILVNVIGSKRC